MDTEWPKCGLRGPGRALAMHRTHSRAHRGPLPRAAPRGVGDEQQPLVQPRRPVLPARTRPSARQSRLPPHRPGPAPGGTQSALTFDAIKTHKGIPAFRSTGGETETREGNPSRTPPVSSKRAWRGLRDPGLSAAEWTSGIQAVTSPGRPETRPFVPAPGGGGSLSPAAGPPPLPAARPSPHQHRGRNEPPAGLAPGGPGGAAAGTSHPPGLAAPTRHLPACRCHRRVSAPVSPVQPAGPRVNTP